MLSMPKVKLPVAAWEGVADVAGGVIVLGAGGVVLTLVWPLQPAANSKTAAAANINFFIICFPSCPTKPAN